MPDKFSIINSVKKLFNTKNSNVQESTPDTSPYPLINWGDTHKQLHPYYGVVGGTYYANTGMPWLSADARKAVKTEWFWQPIRGQPRRVDTNELRKYANTVWVQSIVMHIIQQVSNVPWDIVPKDDLNYYEVEEEITRVKEFLMNPNKNNESWSDLLKAFIKDVLEIDAGVFVKVFSIDSYDFEHLEPRSGAPLLKPLMCSECMGKKRILPGHANRKAAKTLISINSMSKKLPEFVSQKIRKNNDEVVEEKLVFIKPDYNDVKKRMMEIVSANTSFSENAVSVECPFCEGTGQGRHLTEVYVQDGASFLKDCDRTGWTYGFWQYSYAIPAHPMWFSPQEIIYGSMNPRGVSVYGYSPLQSSLEVVKALEYSVKHNMALFLDGAVPDGVVSVEDMSNEELKRMKVSWENDLKGQPHKIIFLNKKTTFAPFAFNNREMQFMESQLNSWKQVMSNFQVSPIDIGLTEDNSRATAGTSAEMGRRKSIRPLLKKIEGLINSQLLPELLAFNVKYSFVLDDPVEERMRADLNAVYLNAGLKSINEIRIEMGLPPVSWGDGQPNSLMGFTNNSGVSMPSENTGINDTINEVRDNPNDVSGESNKDYSYPFKDQVPFVTTIQNLSTPLPFAVPKKGHVNTQYPYNALNGLCPGCGQQSLMVLGESPDTISVGKLYECQACRRSFTEQDLQSVFNEQERLHDSGERTDPYVKPQTIETELNDVLAPKVLRGIRQLEPFPDEGLRHDVPLMDFQTGKYKTKNIVINKKKKVLKKKIKPNSLDLSVVEWVGFNTVPLSVFIKLFLESYDFNDVKGTKKQKRELKDLFLQSFVSGNTLKNLVEQIVSIGFSKLSAESIMRTESVRIANESRLLKYESTGDKYVRFHSTSDNITCKHCLSLSNQVFSIVDAKNVIPVHPMCRCTWLPAVM